jgi:GNAT superfamily N-acetyltransferase
MSVVVRLADLDAERDEIIRVLQENLPYRRHADYFDWLYMRNPAGTALTWVAVEDKHIVGVAAAFPRRWMCAGSEVTAYVLGDFCVDAQHRSLGLAVALQRACVNGISAGDAHFALDFPSRTMMAVYQRLGIASAGTIARHARPLRTDAKLSEVIPVPVLARGTAALANAGLRLNDIARNPRTDLDIGFENDRCGTEYTEAAKRFSPPDGVCTLRTADYLNWRYADHPERKYEILTARRGGKLWGYAVMRMNGSHATVDDLLVETEMTGRVLLARAADAARKRGAHTLSASWRPSGPGKHMLASSGFHAREESPVVLMKLPAANGIDMARLTASWHVTAGDQDG